MRVGEIRQFCKLDGAGEALVRAAMGQMNLSARGYHRVLKLASALRDRGHGGVREHPGGECSSCQLSAVSFQLNRDT